MSEEYYSEGLCQRIASLYHGSSDGSARESAMIQSYTSYGDLD